MANGRITRYMEKGKMTFANDDKYDGEWKDGLRHGKATVANAFWRMGIQMTTKKQSRTTNKHKPIHMTLIPLSVSTEQRKHQKYLKSLQ